MRRVDSETVVTRPASGSLRRLTPKTLLPPAAALLRLSRADQESLRARTTEPAECVYHPDFRRSSLPLWSEEFRRNPHRPWPHVLTGASRDPDGESLAIEVLTAEQERELFFRFNYYRYRVLLILRRFQGQRLPMKAARELLRWERHAQDTRTEIIRANTSLVLAMARRSRNSGVEIAELVSEGNLALLRCVDKFDAARGFKFSTYACRAILASFSRAGAKASRHRSQFPTPYDPAMERSDYLETTRERIEHECVEELKRILFENSADLSPVERRVLTARFSLYQEPEKAPGRRKTLDQVGDLLGVSKERVRQIQNQAMLKIREVLEDRLLVAS